MSDTKFNQARTWADSQGVQDVRVGELKCSLPMHRMVTSGSQGSGLIHSCGPGAVSKCGKFRWRVKCTVFTILGFIVERERQMFFKSGDIKTNCVSGCKRITWGVVMKDQVSWRLELICRKEVKKGLS